MNSPHHVYNELTEPIHKKWNAIAPLYVSEVEPSASLSGIINFEKCLSLRPPDHDRLKLIDIGCGSGMLGQKILQAHGSLIEEYVFVDISETMLEMAQKRLENEVKLGKTKISFLARTIEDLSGVPSDHFDIAIVFFCFHFSAQADKAMTEVKRVIKPQGRLVASVPGHFDSSPFHKVGIDLLREKGLFDQASKGLSFYRLGTKEIFSNLGQVAGFEVVTAYEAFLELKVTPTIGLNFIEILKSVITPGISQDQIEQVKVEFQKRLEDRFGINKMAPLLAIYAIFKRIN